jgi:hypothetical protein
VLRTVATAKPMTGRPPSPRNRATIQATDRARSAPTTGNADVQTAERQRTLTMPISASPIRCRPARKVRSCCHGATIQQESLTAVLAIRLLTCYFSNP